jgi:multimeric flavodoxin WrbA
MKIVGIVGSPRKEGNTEILMKEALRVAGGINMSALDEARLLKLE